jgi:hypothetical protein
MASRSRVRLFLGHLCAKRPENPAVASRVCAHGAARAVKELWNIKRGSGGTQTGHGAAASPRQREPQLVEVGLIMRRWSLRRVALLRQQCAIDVSRPERPRLCKAVEWCSAQPAADRAECASELRGEINLADQKLSSNHSHEPQPIRRSNSTKEHVHIFSTTFSILFFVYLMFFRVFFGHFSSFCFCAICVAKCVPTLLGMALSNV